MRVIGYVAICEIDDRPAKLLAPTPLVYPRIFDGQPAIEQIMPHFIEFLGEADTILLAHNAPFNLGFLAVALTCLGMPYPPHRVIDTLELARWLDPTWPSHSLEHVAAGLKIANRAEHCAV